MYTANCGRPFLPPNCHSSIFTSTLEGAEATFMYQSTFQIWHWSLCKEVNVTAVCTKERKWEPITDNIYTEPTGILYRTNYYSICVRFSVWQFIILIYRRPGLFVWSPLSKANAESASSQPTSSCILWRCSSKRLQTRIQATIKRCLCSNNQELDDSVYLMCNIPIWIITMQMNSKTNYDINQLTKLMT